MNIHYILINSNEQPEFQWDQIMQGKILSAFYYGYFFTQVNMGKIVT